MHKQAAAVIIPIYKAKYSAYELIAVEQCFKILKDHPVIFIKPNSLDILPTVPSSAKFKVISYDDHFFADVNGYNQLMLSEEFYRGFTDYQFILIHQLDAFVFSDRLDYWCGQGYDYIGAPWLSSKIYPHFLSRLKARVKNYLYVRYNAKQKNGFPKTDKQLENRVGNGGFSLRRVELFADYCRRFKTEADKYIAMRHMGFNEDIFWSIELNRKSKRLKIPGLKKALQFAFELNPSIALEKNDGQLPFGCHAWDKNVDFWKPVFKKQGYHI